MQPFRYVCHRCTMSCKSASLPSEPHSSTSQASQAAQSIIAWNTHCPIDTCDCPAASDSMMEMGLMEFHRFARHCKISDPKCAMQRLSWLADSKHAICLHLAELLGLHGHTFF
eukprot:1137212-Pelagomonas_calceolata.AAC.3